MQFCLVEAVKWDNLTREIYESQISKVEDIISWYLEASGAFSARSTYL
jgi:hypothetical protein